MNNNTIIRAMTREEFINRTIDKATNQKINSYKIIWEKLKNIL